MSDDESLDSRAATDQPSGRLRRTDGRDRRADLLAAAADIVREQGFGAVTVKAVTSRIGMSAGLLYRYAGSVDGLTTEVFRRFAGAELAAVDAAVEKAAQGGALARLDALAQTFAFRALRGQRLAWALLVEPVGHAIDAERLVYRAGYANLLTDIVSSGVREGALPNQNIRIAAAGIVGAIGEALVGPLSPVSAGQPDGDDAHEGSIGDPESITDAIVQLCRRAVGAPPREGSVNEDA